MTRKEFNKIVKKTLYKYQYSCKFKNRDYNDVVIKLYIPFFKIKNVFGISHPIYRMHLNIFFKKNNGSFKFCKLEGKRDLYTNKEAAIRYCHSHRTKITDSNEFKDFCLGSAFFNCDNIKTEMQFKFFISVLFNYLACEDLDGVPYIKIQNINNLNLYNLESLYNTFSINKELINKLIDFADISVKNSEIKLSFTNLKSVDFP